MDRRAFHVLGRPSVSDSLTLPPSFFAAASSPLLQLALNFLCSPAGYCYAGIIDQIQLSISLASTNDYYLLEGQVLQAQMSSSRRLFADHLVCVVIKKMCEDSLAIFSS